MKFSRAELAALGLTGAMLAVFALWYLQPAPASYDVSGAHPPQAVEKRVKRVYVPDAPVELNTATEEELMTLPGVGEAKARAIVADRAENGPFTRAEDITRVPGIGPAAYAKMAPYLIVTTP